MSERKSGSSFRAVEFTVSASVLAILASAGAPAPGTELIARNQRAAVETLRTIAEAQARLRSLTAIDTDCDGWGEFGYFAELAGAMPMRVSNASCMPTAGTPADILNPPLLPSAFGEVGASVVRHEGYYFQIWLPNQTAAGFVPAISEHGPTAPFPNPNNGERLWNCYAWPVDYGRTGNWAFFVNEQGIVFKCLNGSILPYDGLTKTPSFHEAYTTSGDMGSSVRIGVAGGPDNTIWASAEPPSEWAEIAANQREAISTMRRIAAAQAELRSAVEIDTNCDGIGEYGYFGELAGRVPMRVSNSSCEPDDGSPTDVLSTPLLPSYFGSVVGCRVVHGGYVFQMWLPHATVAGSVYGFAEHPAGGTGFPFPDPVNGARMWSCYAWPVDYGWSGNRAYFVNQRGIVLEWQNRSAAPYEGMIKTPDFYEAYSNYLDMGSPLRIGVAGGVDDTIWTPVGP